MIPALSALLRSTTTFSPINLFSSGEVGVWYDPQDFSSLFQDSAGTTPVTAVEQPVGLMLDKSKSAVGTNGAYRWNLLTYSEQFDDAAWTKTGVSVTANQTAATNSTTTADLLSKNSGVTTAKIVQTTTVTTSGAHTFSVEIKADTGRWVGLQLEYVASGVGNNVAWFDLQNGVVGTKQTNLAASSITSLGNGWYRISASGTPNATSSGSVIWLTDGDATLSAPSAAQSYYLWGAQVEKSSSFSSYQKITGNWVGMMAGNHATQTTSASRPVVSARYNLLEKTEVFSDSYWTKNNLSVTNNSIVAPDGTTTADTITDNSTSGEHRVYSANLGTGVYTRQIYAKSGTASFISLSAGNTASGYAVFDLSNGTVSSQSNATGAIEAIGSGWYRCTTTGTPSGAGYLVVNMGTTAAQAVPQTSYAGTGSTVYLWGADARTPNDGAGLPAYQRVNTSTEYDTVGFPAYLRFDGTDDYLSVGDVLDLRTNSLTGVVGAQINGATGSLYAKSIANPAAGRYAFVRDTSKLVAFYSKTTGAEVQVSVSDTSISPRVLTSVLDRTIGTDILRVNGSQVATASDPANATDWNTNYRFLIAAYNNSSDTGQISYLNGRIYGMILRFAVSSASDLTNTENWLNSKTKAY